MFNDTLLVFDLKFYNVVNTAKWRLNFCFVMEIYNYGSFETNAIAC